MKTLSVNQVNIIKSIFDKEPNKKLLAIQGNVSTLMMLSNSIGEGLNYSVVQKNLTQLM